MIKVACVSCQSPYDVDERRVPEKGMKMRCPKCGTSFLVARDGTTTEAAPSVIAPGPASVAVKPAIAPPPAAVFGGAPRPAVGLAPPPPAAAAPQRTLLGQRAPTEPIPLDASHPVPAPAAKLGRGTAVGIAPPAAAAPPSASASVTDLPALKPPPKPAVPWGSLAPPAPDAKSSVPRPVPVQGLPKGMMAPPSGGRAPAPAAPAKPTSAASAFGSKPGSPQRTMLGAAAVPVEAPSLTDLPALKVEPAAPKATPEPMSDYGLVDLPVAKVGAAPGSSFGDTDLPTPKLGGASRSGFGEVDLPTPKLGADSRSGFGETDLPTPKASAASRSSSGEADLPAPKLEIDLPAPKVIGRGTGPAFGEIDLPAPKQLADLPAPRQLVDLPAPKQLADLPAPKQLADLPTPKQLADLPISIRGRDLPAPKQGGGFGDLELPLPKSAAAAAGRDETSFGDIELPDLSIASEPSARAAEDDFGDIELPPPRAGAGLIPPKEPTVQGVGARLSASEDESSFGDLNVGNDSMPPSLMSDDETSFGDLQPDDEPVRVAPPQNRTLPMPTDLGGSIPPALRGEDSLDDNDDDPDDFGEVSLPNDDGGDTDEGDDGDSEEDMEFGIAEGATEEGGFSLPPEILRRQRGGDTQAAEAAKGKRAVYLLAGVAIVLAVLGGGGAALGLTDYGFFGVYYLERYLPEAGDPKFARDAIARAEKTAASDTFRDARRSLSVLGESRHKAGLNRELLTRSLLHEALFSLRFGSDASNSSHMAALLQRLQERHGLAPGMALARAADAARRQAWGDVDGPLNEARGEAPNDPYVELVAGEAALQQGKLAPAEKAFGQALKHGGGARAQWGLARVAIAKNDEAAQTTAVSETLKLSPLHVEAHIADARLLWNQGKEDRAMQELRQALGQEPLGDQYLWASKLAQAQGYSLLGYVHESRGRLHKARAAYDDALSADPYLVDALLGAGRVMVREGRYNDALARFESALNIAQKSANPIVLSGRKADAEARLGQGRAQLLLQKAPEAKATLTGLMNQTPNDAEVVLGVGQAEEALGNKPVAEALYRKSVELAPTVFAGYLALSQYYFKQNKADQASEVLNQAAAKVEENAEMRRKLGESELARNRLDSAVHEFRRAVELDPQDLDAKLGLGTALRKSGELDKARALFDEIGARDAHFARLSLERGQLFEAEGSYDKAVESYKKALEKDPTDTDLMLRLGGAQVEAGALDDAEQTLQNVIHETPNSAEAEYFIGRIAFARGRGPDALTHIDRALSLDATQAVFHLYAARAALEMANLARTLDEVEVALARDPALADAYWVRGVVRLRTGAVKDALKDLQHALALKPSRTEALAVVAECYDELRQLPQAVQTFRQALQKYPDNGEWWYKLGRVYLDMGERGLGNDAMKKAMEFGDKKDPMPYWLPDAYRLAGEVARGTNSKKTAIVLYKRYLEIAPDGALDRDEVRKILKGWDVELPED